MSSLSRTEQDFTLQDSNGLYESPDESEETLDDDGPSPERAEFSITPIPDEAAYDLFSLGLYLNELHPSSSATAYLMHRDDHPAIVDSFGETIKGDCLLCVRVRDETLYQEALSSWSDVISYNSQSRDLRYYTSLITFHWEGSKWPESSSWLNIDADYFSGMAWEAETKTGAVYVVLIGPTKSSLFTFPFDEGDGCGLQGTMFGSMNYRPYREYSQEELEEAKRATANLESLDAFEPTYTYCFDQDRFKVIDGEIVHFPPQTESA